MPISVCCPQCQKTYQVADKFAGRKIRCPKCSEGVISIPTPSARGDASGGDALLELKSLAAADSTKGAVPIPRKRASRKGNRVWLLVGGATLGVLLLIGGVGIAISYAWQAVAEMDGLELPNFGIGQDPPPLVELDEPQTQEIIDASKREWASFASSQHPFSWRVPADCEFSTKDLGEGYFRYAWKARGVSVVSYDHWILVVTCRPLGAFETPSLAVRNLVNESMETDQDFHQEILEDFDTKIETRDVLIGGKRGVDYKMIGEWGNPNSSIFFVADESFVYRVNVKISPKEEREAVIASFRLTDGVLGDGQMHPIPKTPKVASDEMTPAEKARVAGIGDWKLYHSDDPPFEIYLPNTHVEVASREGGQHFVWTSQRLGVGNPNKYAVIAVSHFNRLAGESDMGAINRTEKLAQIAPDGTEKKGAKVSRRQIEFKGLTAVERTATGPWGDEMTLFSLSVAHPTGVYIVTGIALVQAYSQTQMMAARDSFRIHAGSPAPAESNPERSQKDPDFQPPMAVAAPPTPKPSPAMPVAAAPPTTPKNLFGPTWHTFKSDKQPFEVKFPTARIATLPKRDRTEYLWIGDHDGFRGGELAPGYAMLRVTYYPRFPGETDQEAVRRIEKLSGCPTPEDRFRGNPILQHVLTRYDNYAVERRAVGKELPVWWVSMTVSHASGVYDIRGVVDRNLVSETDLERLKTSFRFTQ
ncbi:zinc-ribbon domain-containing protein [Blastopirellula sp. JC732]|uniref:Zinc-ribbon domain-containing protein n=1 Tax=Blastopirellula sediminis TaxID=2894196 RepID=A0A9X1MK55_9BACT|nr:zinc-ribbon domain-containing protein [Blastopirellula sediminis]MCC9604424.1 zinc-ribbon domain-containing protein [Blastopirellula sediminis]MCC9626944.1 zinc-ribbon domain-containing protein [Blastopirellula sediminis]